jgi:hypothetical protein
MLTLLLEQLILVVEVAELVDQAQVQHILAEMVDQELLLLDTNINKINVFT